MRSLYFILFVVLAPISVPVFSQQPKIRYTGSIEAALVNGGYESNAAVNITHGIQLKQLSASVGVGIDYYRFRSLPVFLDVKKHMTIGRLHPFIQVSAGMNVSWPTNAQKIVGSRWNIWWQNMDTLSFRNGFYTKAVVGIVLNPGKPYKISAVGGWTYKSVTTTQDEMVFTGTTSRWETRTTVFALNRLYIGLGLSF